MKDIAEPFGQIAEDVKAFSENHSDFKCSLGGLYYDDPNNLVKAEACRVSPGIFLDGEN